MMSYMADAAITQVWEEKYTFLVSEISVYIQEFLEDPHGKGST